MVAMHAIVLLQNNVTLKHIEIYWRNNTYKKCSRRVEILARSTADELAVNHHDFLLSFLTPAPEPPAGLRNTASSVEISLESRCHQDQSTDSHGCEIP